MLALSTFPKQSPIVPEEKKREVVGGSWRQSATGSASSWEKGVGANAAYHYWGVIISQGERGGGWKSLELFLVPGKGEIRPDRRDHLFRLAMEGGEGKSASVLTRCDLNIMGTRKKGTESSIHFFTGFRQKKRGGSALLHLSTASNVWEEPISSSLNSTLRKRRAYSYPSIKRKPEKAERGPVFKHLIHNLSCPPKRKKKKNPTKKKKGTSNNATPNRMRTHLIPGRAGGEKGGGGKKRGGAAMPSPPCHNRSKDKKKEAVLNWKRAHPSRAGERGKKMVLPSREAY